MSLTLAGRAGLLGAVVLLQGTPQIPAPRGLVSDFAGVIPAANSAHIEQIAQDVRAKTGGEMAIVTMSDIGSRAPSDVALQIGREWKVGKMAAIGDKTRNAGVVILLVPKETSSDGQGHCYISTGQGTEGFITDGTSGDICREATPAFMQRDYGTGLELVTLRVAQRFAEEFKVSLDTSLAAPDVQPQQQIVRQRGFRVSPGLILFIFFIVMSILGGGRRRGCFPWWLPFMAFGGGGDRGGWGGGGGGFGGGGGGGFGGFGGGGGFSGGGGGSNW